MPGQNGHGFPRGVERGLARTKRVCRWARRWPRHPPSRKRVNAKLVHARTRTSSNRMPTDHCHLFRSYRRKRRVESAFDVTGPSYDLLVGLHALVRWSDSVVGVSGTYAARARRLPSRAKIQAAAVLPSEHELGGAVLLLTPVLGAMVLWAGDRSAARSPGRGSGSVVVLAAIATPCWPAERKIQTWLAAAPDCGERPLPGL